MDARANSSYFFLMSRRPTQLQFAFKAPHGGKRKGAGRPNRSGKNPHVRRARLDPRHPVHVTLKLESGLPSLRKKDTFRCLRAAVRKARSKGFAVAHFAILSNHIHLILEPGTNSFESVFKSLCISFAKRLNRSLKREGAVFFDRYHVRPLRTPSEVRRTLSYVLTNEARHRQRNSRTGRSSRAAKLLVTIDPFSSAFAFEDWKKLLPERVRFEFSSWPENQIVSWHSEILSQPKTWLLAQGWTRASA